MKRNGKCLMAVLLGVVLAWSGLPITASAAESVMKKTDPYALQCGGDVQPYLYTTPFLTKLAEGGDFAEVYRLVNEDAGISIPAYAVAITGELREGAGYRRVNLEDVQGDAAGKLRAVVRNGYPFSEVWDIQAKANHWLLEQGLPEIAELQSGEAILATQIALWKLADPENSPVAEYYWGWKDMTVPQWKGFLADVSDVSTVYQKPTQYTQWNVEALVKFFGSLDSVPAKREAISDSSLEDPIYSAVEELDGTYTVTVSVSIPVGAGEEDDLNLCASCGENMQTQPIGAEGTYEFIFTGLTDRPAVTLEINGTQRGGDVYLFQGENSTTLIGFDDSVLPVHGEITVTPDRILQIFKTADGPDGQIPLANIQFNIYQAEGVEYGRSTPPTQAEVDRLKTAENLVAILSTDANGFASYNFTASHNPDGIYLIVEQFSPATTGAVDPFYISVPGTDAEGNASYTLCVSPQNDLEPGPEITLENRDGDSFGVGEAHTWVIRCGVPAGIRTARNYVVADVIDARLTYEKGSSEVTLLTRSGAELKMEKADYYTISEEAELRISLTPAGMAFAAANLGEGENMPEIRVSFRAFLNENTAMGAEIPNQASLTYTNSAGMEYKVLSDISEIHTGGIPIVLTDGEGSPLSGGVFQVARPATDLDETVSVLNVGERERQVVFADISVTTDKEGTAVLSGLAFGKYYLVQTKAPEGYDMLSQPIEITVSRSSHASEALRIINTLSSLPETGDLGIKIFTAAGAVSIAGACLLLLLNRKRRY